MQATLNNPTELEALLTANSIDTTIWGTDGTKRVADLNRQTGFAAGQYELRVLEVIEPGVLCLAARGPSRYFGGDRSMAERICPIAVGSSMLWSGWVGSRISPNPRTERYMPLLRCCLIRVFKEFTSEIPTLKSPSVARITRLTPSMI